jgi:hypothetical protein
MIPPDLLFSLFNLMRPRASGSSQRRNPSTAQLRTDVPAIPNPPDRAEWEREHGAKPYQLDGSHLPISSVTRFKLWSFQGQARAAIERDRSTIERAAAIGEQVTLEHVCERVKTECHVPNGDHVFFDSTDNRFWVYPEKFTTESAESTETKPK